MPKKRGFINSTEPEILNRLNIQPDEFVQLIKQKDDLSSLSVSQSVIGSPSAITHYMEVAEKKIIKGLSISQRLFI